MLSNQSFRENSTVASGRHNFNLSTNVTLLLIYTGNTTFADPQCEHDGDSVSGVFLFLLSARAKSLQKLLELETSEDTSGDHRGIYRSVYVSTQHFNYSCFM